MTKDLDLSAATAVNDFSLWGGCPSDLHRLFLNAHLIWFIYWLLGILSWLKTSHVQRDTTVPVSTDSLLWSSHWTPDNKVSTSRTYFHTFLFIPVPLPPLLAPISFHFLLGVGHGFTFQPRHATCHSTEHTHTHIPERGARGMWHLFSLRWAPHVLDLIHIVSEHLGGRRGGCMTRGHSKEKGDERVACVCVSARVCVRVC